MREYLEALKQGKELTVSYLAFDVLGRERRYVDKVTKVTDPDELKCLGVTEMYKIQSQTIFSRMIYPTIEDIERELEEIIENSHQYEIEVGDEQ